MPQPPFRYAPRYLSGAPDGYTRVLIVGDRDLPVEAIFSAIVQTSLNSDYRIVDNGAAGHLIEVTLASRLGGTLEQEAESFARVFNNSNPGSYVASHVGADYLALSEMPDVPLMPDDTDSITNTGNTNINTGTTNTGTSTSISNSSPVSSSQFETNFTKESVTGFIFAAGSIMFLGYAINDYLKYNRIRQRRMY